MSDGIIEQLECMAVIESLQRPDLGREERRKLILESEVLPFRGQQAAALIPFLRQFIDDYRESNVPADLVAVGSAIRNYVATAPTDDAFAAAASLLKADGRLPIPIALEVEMAKMVVRKLTANPPAERDQYPELASRLEELIDAYAKPRFLAREKHGAVALNAILGLVLTRSGADTEVVERMVTLGVPWFQQLLGRRPARLRSELVSRDPDARFADVARTLGHLSELDSRTCLRRDANACQPSEWDPARLGLSRKMFSRLAGFSERAIADWESGKPLSEPGLRRVKELDRLRERLSEIVNEEAIPTWLDAPNEAFGGLKPLEVIERGEVDRLWTMIYHLESGVAS